MRILLGAEDDSFSVDIESVYEAHGLAVHRTVGLPTTRFRRWSVTHVASGRRLRMKDTVAEAIWLVDEVAGAADWSLTTVPVPSIRTPQLEPEL
jgi:hypothetical protein